MGLIRIAPRAITHARTFISPSLATSSSRGGHRGRQNSASLPRETVPQSADCRYSACQHGASARTGATYSEVNSVVTVMIGCDAMNRADSLAVTQGATPLLSVPRRYSPCQSYALVHRGER